MSLFPYSNLLDEMMYWAARSGARPSNSVYVISDSQLAEWKAKQAAAEIAELDRLIDDHKQSIERLEATKQKLNQDVQRTSLSESPQESLQAPDSPESKTSL
jgi:hypothetical protein